MIFLVWIVCTAFIVHFANKRGRDWRIWGLCSFLISPLLTFIILLIIGEKHLEDTVDVTSDDMLIVEPIIETNVIDDVQGESSKNDIRKCPLCGEPLRNSNNVCKYCGTEIGEV